MQITITVQELVLLVLGIAGIIFIFYLIGLVKNLIETVKHTNKVLEDTEVITAIAASKAKDIDGAVDGAVEAIGTISELIKGNQSAVKAATNVVNSVAGLKNIFGAKSKKD
ncbi:MAG: hypothetical protein HFG67_02990 [Firmicutes bacterium]|nr:hypothetical protein [Bacillota bacterium]